MDQAKLNKQAQLLIYGMYLVIGISLVSFYVMNKKVDKLRADKK